MRTALVTGITGQDGSYLAEMLAGRGDAVVGMAHSADGRLGWLRTLVPSVRVIEGDLRDAGSVAHAVDEADPDVVYNLAAYSSVAASWRQPEDTAEVTGLGVLRLLEAVRAHQESSGRVVRIVQASSAEIFGDPAVSPQTEATPLRPRSPYGVAKAFGHQMAATYRESYGMHVSCAVLYNHESPRRPPEFVTRKITRAAARIALGIDDGLALGNLDAARDWGYALDYVRALTLMAVQPEPDDYVIATGHAFTVREFVAAAFVAAGVPDWERHVVVDPGLLRPLDAGVLVGDPTKAAERLGWRATTSLDELAQIMVAEDLAHEREATTR